MFDLGGGSLECLDFRDRRVVQAVSLPLGCVRLTEIFVADPAAPFAADRLIAAHVRKAVVEAGFSLAQGGPAVGTGGTLTTARAVLGARKGLALEDTDPRLAVSQLREMLTQIGGLSLAEKAGIPGLPSGPGRRVPRSPLHPCHPRRPWRVRRVSPFTLQLALGRRLRGP